MVARQSNCQAGRQLDRHDHKLNRRDVRDQASNQRFQYYKRNLFLLLFPIPQPFNGSLNRPRIKPVIFEQTQTLVTNGPQGFTKLQPLLCQ